MSDKEMGKRCLLKLSNHGERGCDASAQSAHTHRYPTSGKRKKLASTGGTDTGKEEEPLTARRKGLVGSARQHESALNIAATSSPATEIIDLSDEELEDVPAEIRSASESLQGDVLGLQSKDSKLLLSSKRARALEEENFRMKGEVERWQTLCSEMAIRLSEQKADYEAAAAAKKIRFEAEKGQLEDEARERLEQFEENVHEYCNRLEEEARERLDAEKAWVAEETRKDAHICQICFDRPRNTVLIPCLHGQYCSECLEEVRKTGKPCPTCRGPVAGTVPYIA